MQCFAVSTSVYTFADVSAPGVNIGETFPLFTGKELDPETGLYYYGARYLDPKYSIWISADPALGEYIPGAPVNDEAKKRNGNLPGMGGVFNTVNLHLYHYAGIEQRSFELNNPVKYVDPDGRWSITAGFGGGVAGKIKIGVNNGKFEITWRIGFGIGGVLKVDFSDQETVTDVKQGIYLEGALEIESPMGDAAISATIAVEGVSQEKGKLSMELTNEALLSAGGLTEETININISDGNASIEPSQNTEMGIESMLFLGFGGQDSFTLSEKER